MKKGIEKQHIFLSFLCKKAKKEKIMDLNTLLNHYKTLLPWNRARIKCFAQIIFGMIIASNVQQHK
ncbi:MAG: hypothetical protein Q8929_04480, partial [Bacillota bacterium]|nr:hypothetical protein [Bacillota bacterium]